ncbi:MAG: phosphoglucomutase [Treponema sp.]|nr:phosphoglucomutase [Treponema sp.]
MILSASGWRKVFTQSKDGEDSSPEIGKENELICALIGETFAQYVISASDKTSPVIAIATDTRPTGTEIADAILKALQSRHVTIQFLGVASAPEIMAYAKNVDGFLYISASHNPIGHNGIKFGLNDGGVLEGSEAKKLIEEFEKKCLDEDAEKHAQDILSSVDNAALTLIKNESDNYKKESIRIYDAFIKKVITGSDTEEEQNIIFNEIKSYLKEKTISIVCDMNGSARSTSIDKTFIPSCNLKFIPFNDEPGKIVHGIIPEPENLIHCATKMQQLQYSGDETVILGYMPDCDGDRGNIVYWNERSQKALPIPAQTVFALCVMAELSFEYWKMYRFQKKSLYYKAMNLIKRRAVAVNCPTSMRIDDICKAFNIFLFRAEVGEANVVNLAQKKRSEGYSVRILGEGSNGGNITEPSHVRDPLATMFAIIKLLTIKDYTKDGITYKGLFHIWCEKSGQLNKYKEDFSIVDILDTLPVYATTGVSESRAVLSVKTPDKGLLKQNFQTVFMKEWAEKKEMLTDKYDFESFEADCTNGTEEKRYCIDWNNGTGGLKIKFYDSNKRASAFIWMRPSGTEPVFRILCDVKGDEFKSEEKTERELLEWETEMLQKADLMYEEE